MYNNKEISSLSREELTKALQKFQLKCGPITHTTRRVFENRLKAYLEKCNAEVESKEDKENWIMVDDKCYNGFNGKHDNLKCEENGLSIKHTNNYDNHLVTEKHSNNYDNHLVTEKHTNNYDNHLVTQRANYEKNYMSELTIIKTESFNSTDSLCEKLSNGDVEAANYGNCHSETIINIDSDKANNDSSLNESKSSHISNEQGNSDQSKVVNINHGVVAHCILDHTDSGVTYNRDIYVNRIGQVNREVNILANVQTTKVDFTHNAVLLNNLKTEIDVTHNAVLLNGVQSSEGNAHNTELLNGVQTPEDRTHDAVLLNSVQTLEETVLLNSAQTSEENTPKPVLLNSVPASEGNNIHVEVVEKPTNISGSDLNAATLITGVMSNDTQSSTTSSNLSSTETASVDIKSSETFTETSTSNAPSTKTVPDVVPVPEIIKSPMYYGIWIPYSSARINGNKAIVCDSQKEALQKMKGFKGSRFKVFESIADAEKFSLSKTIQSCEKVPPSPPPTCVPAPEPKEKILKCPTFQEVIKFRQHIEKFKSDEIEACLANPRYLISPSDIPVILQEGSRMNAVHIATKCNRVKVLKMIFNVLQSQEFLQLAYSNASESHLEFRKNHLLDLYLNTPEKILCDTPLHMACKFGYTSIVKFLLTFKQLKINAQNTDRQSSIEVVCDRFYARTISDRDKVKSEILSLFEEKAYVPLYDNEDGMQSKIGQPILSISPNEIYSSKVKVKAYAGPMSPEQASNVFEKWRKSPRNRALSMIARSDYEKGMERIGRTIASDENVPFTEYWPFLDKYTNLTTSQGLKKLEKYLKSKYTAAIQNCKKENCTSFTTTKKNSKNKSRRTSDSSNNENEKHPNDIKRKLTFDEGKPKSKNENKTGNDKNTVKNKKKHSNTDVSLANQQQTVAGNKDGTLVNNQLKVVSSEKGPESNVGSNSNKKTTVLDEKSSSHQNDPCIAETQSNKNDMVNGVDGKMESKPENSLSMNDNTQNSHTKDIACKIRNNLTNCTPNNVTSHSFCINKTSANNNCMEVGDFKKNEDTGINDPKHTALRCSPLLCLCDINISEECYLSEAFSQLNINSDANVVDSSSRRSHLSEDGNVDMDLVNQSVSFQTGKPLQNGGEESKASLPNETLCNTFKQLDVNSDKITNSSNNVKNSKLENTSLSSVDDIPVPPSASSISPAPSLSVFDSPQLPTSSFNSPSPSLSSFDNKISIPGIINLPVKLDSGTEPNCFPEQHAVFIDGEQPSKHDLDVLRALGTTVEIDNNFPHIRRWKCLIESYSDDMKSSWPSPGSPRYVKTLRRTLWTA